MHEPRAQDPGEVIRNFDTMINLWLSCAAEFSRQTAFLPISVKVSCSAWATNAAYRANHLRQMGITLIDNSNATVPDVGGGSYVTT